MERLRLLVSALVIGCISLIVFSCNTTGVSPTNFSRLQVINALPGSLSIDFSLNSTKANTTTIAFPNSSGYVSTVPGEKSVGIRPTSTPSTNYLTSVIVNLKKDTSYSLFFTGVPGAYKNVFLTDSLSAPKVGRAKVRFVNASSDTTSLDITANAIVAFKNIAVLKTGNFIEVPAGTYEFRAYKAGSTANTLATLSNQTLADGKIYTLYSAGQASTTATNAAFGLNLTSNLLPARK
jgi:hypothetical protein